MDSAIVLESISRRLGDREVLRDVSFTVERGDIFGFLGPNGSGKTTTIRIILGLLQPSAGRVSICGQDIHQSRTRRKVGFLLEVDGLYDNLTAYANLNYYARIYGIAHPREMITQNLQLVKLAERAGEKVSTYSKGMRQRLAFARALLCDPEVLILDEPSSGLDPSGQMEFRHLILDKARQENKTIFLSSHNLDEVQRICNRIAFIQKGQIKLCGEREHLQRQMTSRKLFVTTAQTISGPVIAELKYLPGVSIEDQTGPSLVLSLNDGFKTSDIVDFLTARDVKIEEVKYLETSLEDIYTGILQEVKEP
jgi:ABC-2 type transport system ATP-binding protein